jgi:hypothetical protein
VSEVPNAVIRLGMPAASILSRQPWVGERAATLLPLLEERIRERCEQFAPLSVFLGGSALHGELCGVIDPAGGRVFLSDLDLSVLTVRRVPGEAADRIAREVRALSADGPPATLGFYCREDLARQHPTPGLVETTRVGIVLSGESSFLARMRMPPPERIPPGEARRLLANRAIEWFAARQERRTLPVGAVYAAAKFHADAGAVYLLAEGAYRGGGYTDRLEQIRHSGLDPAIRAGIEGWSEWRLRPLWDSVPAGGDVIHAAASDELDRGVGDAARSIVRTIAGSESAGRFLEPSRIGGRAWARSWKRWVRKGGTPLRRIGVRDLPRTPRLLLWEAAIDCLMGREDRGSEILSRLRGMTGERPAGLGQEIVRLNALMEREGIE